MTELLLPVTGLSKLLIPEHIQLENDDIDSNNLSFLIKIPIKLKRCGIETKLIVQKSNSNQHLEPNANSLRALQEALKKGVRWNNALLSGKSNSTAEIAEQNDITLRYVSQLIKLALLSPDNIKRIFKGDIPHNLTLSQLKRHIPLDWAEQDKLFI